MSPAARSRRASEAAEARHARRRLREAYTAATPAVRDAGRRWYPAAEREAAALGRRHDYTRRQAAGIIAALSPRNQWARNLSAANLLAETVAAGFPAPSVGLSDPVWKAERIAERRAHPLKVLGGPKVRAFYRNLCGDRDAVTVDVWAARAALGRWVPPVGRRYTRIADAYRAVAAEVGEHPRDFQAIIWLHVRGDKPSDPESFRPIQPLECEA